MNEPEPSRLDKLRAVETYLQWQLDRIRKNIADEEARLATQQPATAWRLQHLPGGTRGRGLLHRDGCPFDDDRSGVLDWDAAVVALGEETVEVCEACRPEVGLRG